MRTNDPGKNKENGINSTIVASNISLQTHSFENGSNSASADVKHSSESSSDSDKNRRGWITISRQAETIDIMTKPESVEKTKSFKDCCSKFKKDNVKCSTKSALVALCYLFPLFLQLRQYKWKSWILNDVLSGVCMGAMHVPQSMGFALMVSVPPANGLYTSFFMVVVYTIFATSRHLSFGTHAIISLMVGSVVNREVDLLQTQYNGNANMEAWVIEEKIGIASSVCLLVGIFLTAMSFCRLGIISNYMSLTFIRGLLGGTWVYITSSQIPLLLGLKIKNISEIGKIPKLWMAIFKNIGDVSASNAICGVLCTVFLILVKLINHKLSKTIKFPIPSELLMVITATLICHFAKLDETVGIRIIGEISLGFPAAVFPSMTNFRNYILDSFMIAIVSFATSITMCKMLSIKHNYKIDANRELLAYGLSHIVPSFFHSFAGAQAPPRTLVHEEIGKTQVANLFCALFLMCVCLFMGTYLKSVPTSGLASLIIVAIWPLLLTYKDIPKLWKINKWEFSVWIITWCSVVFLDIAYGIVIGIVYSVFVFLLQAQFRSVYLHDVHDQRDLIQITHNGEKLHSFIRVISFPAPLFFANVERFERQIEKHILSKLLEGQSKKCLGNNKGPLGNYVILDCSGITYIDSSGINAMNKTSKKLKDIECQLILCQCTVVIMQTLQSMDDEDKKRVLICPTIHDAVAIAVAEDV